MDVILALGGGGVKGHAHAGVLQVLDREGFRVRAIAGTSAGGLWGSFYAAGYSPADIEDYMSHMDPDTLYDRNPHDGPAMMGIAGIRQMVEELLGNRRFEELQIPLAMTAVDIDRARLVILDKGRVAEAVYATIAVPGVFPPVTLGDRTLVDGGVLMPVPVAVARQMAAKISPGLPVVSVVLSPDLAGWGGPSQPRLLNSLPFLATYLARLRIAQAMNIFMRSIDIGGALLTELRLQVEKPDVLIRPDVGQIGLLDQVDIFEVARLGELAAEASLPVLRQATRWDQRLMRRLEQRNPGLYRLGDWDEP